MIFITKISLISLFLRLCGVVSKQFLRVTFRRATLSGVACNSFRKISWRTQHASSRHYRSTFGCHRSRWPLRPCQTSRVTSVSHWPIFCRRRQRRPRTSLMFRPTSSKNVLPVWRLSLRVFPTRCFRASPTLVRTRYDNSSVIVLYRVVGGVVPTSAVWKSPTKGGYPEIMINFRRSRSYHWRSRQWLYIHHLKIKSNNGPDPNPNANTNSLFQEIHLLVVIFAFPLISLC